MMHPERVNPTSIDAISNFTFGSVLIGRSLGEYASNLHIKMLYFANLDVRNTRAFYFPFRKSQAAVSTNIYRPNQRQLSLRDF